MDRPRDARPGARPGWHGGAGGRAAPGRPARDGVRPNPGVASTAPELQVGRKHNVPGPAAFALWPGQMARVFEGHRLRADEYLYVRIYDAAAATTASSPSSSP